MTSVLVLDANQRSALATTRSLGKHGISVITADITTSSLAGSSKHSKSYYKYPPPQTHELDFFRTIQDIINHENIQMIIPMTELTVEIVLRNSHNLPDIHIPFPDINTVNFVSNKNNINALATKLGLPTVKTRYIRAGQSPIPYLEDAPYPVIFKPEKSWIRHNGIAQRVGVHVAKTPDEAISISQNDIFKNCNYMIQEYIEGHGAGIFCLYQNGSPVTFFAHKRLREKPPEGGVSVLSKSIIPDNNMVELSKRILDHVRWHGVAMVEFKVGLNGTPYLMEINTRFWGSLQLSIDAGIDFPWLLYQSAYKRLKKIDTSYAKDIQLRWLLGDLDSLYLTLRDPRYTLRYKLKALAQFFTPSMNKTRHEVNRLDDFLPAIYELKEYIRAAL